MHVVLDVLATQENFNEAEYLAANPDVAAAVREGVLPSGRIHFDISGRFEKRMLRRLELIKELQRQKMVKLQKCLNFDMPHIRKGLKFDFLTDELRKETGICDTSNVSGWEYGHDYIHEMIQKYDDGLSLDCGSGRRPTYYSNVGNYEIVDYDTTDVIGVGERLPFKNNCFDGVISVAVLEHVRDPFACASEIVRVLRPGGRLFCVVPFLQPEHGYPHHYYNMAPQGARALFERGLTIDQHSADGSGHPIWALRWIVQRWADGLDDTGRETFLSMPLREVIEQVSNDEIMAQDWVTGISERKKFELACGTIILAHKPDLELDVSFSRGPVGEESQSRSTLISRVRSIGISSASVTRVSASRSARQSGGAWLSKISAILAQKTWRR
jgi:SAM-dependent methyltransferase